jgi:hypothetical protein
MLNPSNAMVLNHPLLADMYQLYSRHAFEIMLNECMNSHELFVTQHAQIQQKDKDPQQLVGLLRRKLPQGQITVHDPNRHCYYTVTISGLQEEDRDSTEPIL